MKKLFLVALFAASGAFAKDMTGRFGVGGDQTLGGVSGLSLQYQFTRLFGIQIVTGVGFTAPAADGADNVVRFGEATTVFLNLADFENSNLHVGAGYNIITDSRFDQNLALSFDIPVRVVYFPTNNISFHCQVGINLSLLQHGNDSPVPPPNGTDHESDMILSMPTNLLGQAGFTFWF